MRTVHIFICSYIFVIVHIFLFIGTVNSVFKSARTQSHSEWRSSVPRVTGDWAHCSHSSKQVEKSKVRARRRVHHIRRTHKFKKLYFLFDLTLARGVPACCSVNTVQARVKRATLSPVATLPTGAHPAIPAITAPRISHEPAGAAAAPRALLRRGHLARATRRLPSRAHLERISSASRAHLAPELTRPRRV